MAVKGYGLQSLDGNPADYITNFTDYYNRRGNTTPLLVGEGVAINGTEASELPLLFVIPVASAMILLSIITTLGNALVIYAIKTERRLQTVSNYFICSLAVADTMVGLFVMPISIAYFINNFMWSFGLILCQMWLSVDYVSCTASIFNLFILSLDRYWSVKNPLKYLRKRTGKRAALMISFVWCLSFLWIIAVVFWHLIFQDGDRRIPPNECDTEFTHHQTFKIVTAMLNFYLPLSLMIILYGKIYKEIRERAGFEVGNKTSGKVTDTQCHAMNVKGQRNVKNGVREGLLNGQNKNWTPDFDSGSSSPNSSDNSGNQTDSAESTKITDSLRRKPRIDSQLRSISQMAFVTTGLAGFIHYPDGTADDVSSRYLPSQSNHVQTLMQVQEVSNEVDASQNENENKTNEFKTKVNNNETFVKNEQEIAYSPPKVQIKRKSILRQSNSYGEDAISRKSTTAQSQRKISFSLEHPRRKRNTSFKEDDFSVRRRHYSLDSHKYKGVRRKESPTTTKRFSLQNGHTQVKDSESIDSRKSSTGSVLSNFRVSFARFSIKKNQTSEVIKGRIRRFSVHKERKAAKQLGIIIGCFVTCWLPYFISFMIVAISPNLIPNHVHYALIWLGYINSTLNPFIYPMCNGNFRKSFKRILYIRR